MDKMLEKVNENLDIIRKKSQEKYDSMFFTSSDGKHIMKEYEEIYNNFLLVQTNDSDVLVEETTLPVVDVAPAPIDFEDSSDNLEEVKPKLKTDLPVVELSPVLDSIDSAIDLVEQSQIGNHVETAEDSVFSVEPADIIQDMPIKEEATQSFKSPGMSEEQIRTSQNLIDSVPSAQDVDPLQAEIDRLKDEYDNRKTDAASTNYTPMTDEEVRVSQEKISSSPSNTSRKKIVKVEHYTWKDKIKRKVSGLRGILYKENFGNHSPSYMRVCQLIANFRVNYRNISVDEADKGLEAIDRVISESNDLSFEEKKRLYRKLTRLVKAVERVNIQKEKNAAAPSMVM